MQPLPPSAKPVLPRSSLRGWRRLHSPLRTRLDRSTNMSSHIPFPKRISCAARKCCSTPLRARRGAPLCRTLCVCLLCAQAVAAQAPPEPTSDEAGSGPNDPDVTADDSSSPPENADSTPEDADSTPEDSSSTPEDADSTPEDASSPPEDPGPPAAKPQPVEEEEASSEEEDGVPAAPARETPELDATPDVEIIIQGKRHWRTENRSASDFEIKRDVLAAAPRKEGAEVLRTAPGVYIGRGEGGAVAHNYMLRGFDSKHGQDIEFRVGGLPINLPAHIHGQGYSDLGFLIGETVQELRVSEGVYDPRQGDFAVAGSIDIGLGVEGKGRGVRFRSGYGAFNTRRQFAMWAPKQAAEESFGALQYTSTDGFGENRAGKSANGVLQHRFGEGEVTYRAIGIARTAHSQMAGVLRKSDVQDDKVCFECVYPYPTARAQNALTSRVLAGVFADYAYDSGSSGQLGAWVGYDKFRIQQNFTGFQEQSGALERVGGRGDLIEQENETSSVGITGRYRSAPFRPASWAIGSVEAGTDGRLDSIEQTQNLLDASARNQTWDNRVDATVNSFDLGIWGDFDWTFARLLSVRAGLRADVLSYDIEDRLGNFAPLTRPQDSFIRGFRRSAMGTAWGPRTSLTYRPLQWVSVLAAYGEGYRSPQARLLEDGEEAPFSKVHSSDLGVKFDWNEMLQLALGGYFTHLSDDVAFDAGEGRLERIGASERLGLVVNAVSRPFSWLVASGSVTYVQATLLEPPPPTAEEPQPPFVEGQSLPFVPPVVVRADVGANDTFRDDFHGHALGASTGLGFSYLSPRPLPYGEFAEPVAVLDASAGVTWGAIDLSFDVFNVLNSRYAAVEYSFASDWTPGDGVRTRTPARHSSAGAPRSWMLSLGVQL